MMRPGHAHYAQLMNEIAVENIPIVYGHLSE